ncbi:phospholipase D-like domain-containing protein [Mesorhizobium sp. A623]
MDLAVSRLAKDKIRTGNTGLLLIADNYDAFAARILATRSATRTLDLMYYLWHDDHTGRLLMQEVVRAAERGVRVRILLDDINSPNSDSAYQALDAHPNVELKLFNPSGMRNGSLLRGLELVFRLFAMTRRMHNKAWIADDTIAIVGGRNIGDAYFDAAETNFRDLDLLLVGPAVSQATRIFEAFWNSSAVMGIGALHPGEPAEVAGFVSQIDRTEDTALLDGLRSLNSITEFIAAGGGFHWTTAARVISDPPEKVRGEKTRSWLMRELLPILQSSAKNLEIVSPYFIPGRKGTAIFSQLVAKGSTVTVLTNSLAATDVATVHGAYANYRKRLLKAGIRLFELQPFSRQANISVFGSKGASLHTKAFTVDGKIGFVGSFNFDPRSISLNAEMGVLFEDEWLAAELRRRFRHEILPQTSYAVTLRDGRLVWTGIDQGQMHQYTTEPEASLSRRVLAKLVRWLPIESQL